MRSLGLVEEEYMERHDVTDVHCRAERRVGGDGGEEAAQLELHASEHLSVTSAITILVSSTAKVVEEGRRVAVKNSVVITFLLIYTYR